MNAPPSHLLMFGDFRVDLDERRLFRADGTEVLLTPRVFETLRYLVEHAGRVIDKRAIMDAVWADCIVEENNLAQAISKLRQIFGEKTGAPRYIATLPGRGYRFVAEITAADEVMEPARPRAARSVTAASAEISREISQRPARGRTGSMVVALGFLLLLAAAFFWWRNATKQPAVAQPNESSAPVPEKSIAVLPFDNLSPNEQDAYFAIGMQEEILTRLAKLGDITVISRMSVLPYKEKSTRNLPEIARQLGVTHLLEGSVQRAGQRVRVNAQLIATQSGAHVWAESYDRELADLFAIQTELANAIARQLQAKISPREQAALAEAPTNDLTANDLYTRALILEVHIAQHPSLLKAVELLGEAVERDPQFLRAWCALGRIHVMLYFLGYDHTGARREMADAAIRKAAQLQPEAGEVHLARAEYFAHGFRNFDQAQVELDLARQTLPNDPTLFALLATVDRRRGRWEQALRNFEHALALDPRNLEYLMHTAQIYAVLRRYREAEPLSARARAISPHNYWARYMGPLYIFEERADLRPLRAELNAILAEDPEAAPKIAQMLYHCALLERDPAAIAQALAVIPPQGMVGRGNFVRPREWFVAYAARILHDDELARASFLATREILQKQLEEEPDRAPAWSLLGRTEAALGNKEEAIRAGRRACELLPVSVDAWSGPGHVKDLIEIYSWVGDTDIALQQLALRVEQPPKLSYGALKLEPDWDALRGHPRFEEIVAALAPNE